jgi:hypothetical protein
MSCNIEYEKFIFSIHKKSRFNNDKYYVFIGIVENNIKKILNKLENRENILKEDLILLKNKYPNDFMSWINIVKEKIKIKFINNTIRIDDTINEIRNKIFVYLSDIENKSYILPKNQELWMKKKNNSYEIIGYYYENIQKKDKENINPHIFDKFDLKENKLFLDTNKLKKNTSENNIIIYDLIEESDFIKNVIYLSDAKEEEEFLKSKKVNISESIINNYFKKYWPYLNLNYDLNEVKNNYIIVNDYLEKENYIFNLIDSIKINDNKFGSCNILTTIINISNNENNEYIDLYQIFDYLKDNQINENVPFIKYSEESFESPFSIVSKKAIDNKKIDKTTLSKWLGLKTFDKEEGRKMNGLMIKKYSKDFDNIPRYYSIILKENGLLSINISYTSENNASFHDIEHTVKDCKKFIENINKNRIIKKIGEKSKIDLPELIFKDNKLHLNKHTKITYMNITIPLNFDKPINFKKLYEFTKKFPYFLAEVPKNIIKQNNKINKTENSIQIKYKKISRFVNMNDILLEIDKLKDKQLDSGLILKILENKYQKSIDEIKSYLLEWERKYSSSKSSKSSEFKQGILITITDKKILIQGITNIYQIPLIYKFFTTFMTLYIDYDNYLKDKEFRKFFVGKNMNNKLDIYDNSYEYNNNISIIDLNKINYNEYNVEDYENLNEDIEELDNNENEDNNNENKSVKTYNQDLVGIANNEDIDPNILLTCNDSIPEKGTCEDFCNDEFYFIRRLQKYDIKLFRPNKGVKEKYEKYTKGCQAKCQPIVLSEDPEKNPNIKRDSYTYSIKYSSDPNIFQRWYICPTIWCPYCEIPILINDVDPKTIKLRVTKDKGRMCKTGKCPYGDHQVFIREKNNEVYNYPGFLTKGEHPNGLCLPCCYKVPKNLPKVSSYKSFKKCLGEDIENNDVKEGQIYILGKGVPIEKGRYGKLNLELERLLKTNLETGYLGLKSGYLRKGINHLKNNSFLSAISDIISCDKINTQTQMSVDKLKHLLCDKLDNNLFKSLYSGNLINIFYNIENFKKYLLNDNIEINHKYLWDFLQRENIMSDEGINIFIFENNTLLCPKGENIEFFYDKNKKNILLIKSKEYYEPIYYLEGNGKTAKTTCIFELSREEIKKIYDISKDGCKVTNKIKWLDILNDNIKKYDLNIDNLVLINGDNLQTTLNELLLNIKNKKLDDGFLPKLQYVDSYNKVFGLELKNGLYLPVEPTKLNNKIEYKIILDLNDINHLSYLKVLEYTKKISTKTKLKCNITHKILDILNKKNIIALVNENNRFIPIIHIKNNENKLKISTLNYYSDVDESLYDKIEKVDKRVEIMNKKLYEDETYIRLKFELSKFLQIKENINYYNKILEIINSDDKNIKLNRSKMFILLNNIYSTLITFKDNNIDYYDYKLPNKRIPCFLRKINKSNNNDNNDINLSCNNDPHCSIDKNKCKLFINKINLINKDRKINNYNFYLSRIIDELLRFKMKRNEILNDNIPIIINKENISENINKYIVIHTNNMNEINNIVEKLYYDNYGILFDTRNLYENISTKEYSFKEEKYLKTDLLKIENTKTEELSIYWIKILGNKFRSIINSNDSLFALILQIINMNQFKNIRNDALLTIDILKSKIINYFNAIKIKENILELYKTNKYFKNIESIEFLKGSIIDENYNGSEIDLEYISNIFNINFIILDKRIKKNEKGYRLIKSVNYKKNYFVLLYKTIIYDKLIYNLIEFKNNILFKLNDLPSKLTNLIMTNNKSINNNK